MSGLVAPDIQHLWWCVGIVVVLLLLVNKGGPVNKYGESLFYVFFFSFGFYTRVYVFRMGYVCYNISNNSYTGKRNSKEGLRSFLSFFFFLSFLFFNYLLLPITYYYYYLLEWIVSHFSFLFHTGTKCEHCGQQAQL